MRTEDPGSASGAYKRSIYIAQHIDGNAGKTILQTLDGKHTGPAVAGCAPAQTDDHPPTTVRGRCQKQFADTPGRGQQGISLGGCQQMQSAGLGHFDDSQVAADSIVCLDRPPQRVGYDGFEARTVQGVDQHIQRTFSTIRQRTFNYGRIR